MVSVKFEDNNIVVLREDKVIGRIFATSEDSEASIKRRFGFLVAAASVEPTPEPEILEAAAFSKLVSGVRAEWEKSVERVA